MTALPGMTPGREPECLLVCASLVVDSCLYSELLHRLSRQCFPTVCWAGLCSVRKRLLSGLLHKNTAKEQGYMASPDNSNRVHQLIGAQLNKKAGLREAGTEERGSKSHLPHTTPRMPHRQELAC